MVKLGQRGEDLAASYLQKNGYKIIQRNYKTMIGEIDIIARDRDDLVFIEVKTRESLEYGQPFESVNKNKRRKIANVAMLYLKKLKNIPACRFDVVSVYYEEGRPEFKLIQDAFEM
jgi:putative endonuclease